jgi:hypothetical protein
MGARKLNDVVLDVIEAIKQGAVVNKRRTAVERWDEIDADGQYLAGIEGLVARIDAKARQVRLTSQQRASEAQAALPFALPVAVSMDIEGHTILATRGLSRGEFLRAIRIREQQNTNDSQALREWRTALQQADRIWARHPDWTFGQCLDAILDASVPTAA